MCSIWTEPLLTAVARISWRVSAPGSLITTSFFPRPANRSWFSLLELEQRIANKQEPLLWRRFAPPPALHEWHAGNCSAWGRHSPKGRGCFLEGYYIRLSQLHRPASGPQSLKCNAQPWVLLSTPFEVTAEAMRCRGRRPERHCWSRKGRSSHPGYEGTAPLCHFRKQGALRCRDSGSVTRDLAAAAAVASEVPGSLRVEERDPDPLLPRVCGESRGNPQLPPLGPLRSLLGFGW